ncbi:MAG TPA: MotA/TolQ/ExbB proton channel family protein [Candidatus Hydrogenedentes bacterium]|jgi:biopolymer transport protein ExbB|nr:MotA/TolQ/ExbB proton channel family protein [Candidatus Hydrogenedentota bacterium]MDY0032339.1 MotA/TolQ/ExbB proton channel family protein [FCB group bacterium]NLT61770.1 MotA/TolQ/ExbB proton channel family protein [Candidatus Hydrogenedentota bacterium]HNV20755.1 MotA/TolQ/ExbB proton channel family protein [Candidatus Hydrogenedentota bacterium]HNZ16850.1 MotA/TolQ/ExbB proton channel family protein [Candidatus Hydrogenedentota bacterium]
MRWSLLAAGILLAGVVCMALAAEAQESEPPATEEVAVTPVAETAQPEQLTLAVMIREGGWILYVIIGLSVITFIMLIYFFFTITPAREVPPNLLKRALSQIRAGDLRGAYQMCDGRDELLANVIKSGLKMAGHDRYVIQEAMESEGERGAAALWQRISYINNVGVIAPLLGLLGTVWGMMRAFGAIAFDDAQSRALSMAYSVSMAMITTAAGLLLAIPALLAYYYFRGRVIKIIAEVEAQASEVVEALSRGEGV